MNKLFKASLAATAAALMTVSTFALPANADLTLGNGLGMTVDITEVGTGSSRTITWTVTVTDSQGRTFVSGTPAAGQIGFGSSSARACETAPLSFELESLNSGKCSSYFNSGGVTPTISGSTMTVVYNSRDHVGGNFSTGLTGYLGALGSNKPVAATVAYLRFPGVGERYSLYSTGGPATAGVKSDMDPGVSFAGFLIGGATGRVVAEDTAGTLRLTGKRLHLVHSATIGGIEVTVSSATRSAVELDFDALPAGKHDVVLKTKAGSATTLRGFVTVN